jgi:hypothetical protein
MKQVFWGLSLALLALPGLADEPVWPDEPPIPVMKPTTAPVLAGAEMLRLEILLLASARPVVRSADGTATLAIEPAPVAEVAIAESASRAVDLPIPVPKPSLTRVSADLDAAPAQNFHVDMLSLKFLGNSLAAIEASAASAGPSQASPFAPPPLTTEIALGLDSTALRFALSKTGDLALVPSLQVVGLPSADPNLVRMSAPHEPRITPTPGLDAVMTLGDVTLDARVNQPLRAIETKTSPDTRPLADRSNFGVDMKLKF